MKPSHHPHSHPLTPPPPPSHGELWGLCAHPSKPFFYTAGDDCTVRCWSLETQTLVSYLKVPDKSRCLSISPDGTELRIGFNSGSVWVSPTEPFFNGNGSNSQTGTNAASVVNFFSGEEIAKPEPARWRVRLFRGIVPAVSHGFGAFGTAL